MNATIKVIVLADGTVQAVLPSGERIPLDNRLADGINGVNGNNDANDGAVAGVDGNRDRVVGTDDKDGLNAGDDDTEEDDLDADDHHLLAEVHQSDFDAAKDRMVEIEKQSGQDKLALFDKAVAAKRESDKAFIAAKKESDSELMKLAQQMGAQMTVESNYKYDRQVAIQGSASKERLHHIKMGMKAEKRSSKARLFVDDEDEEVPAIFSSDTNGVWTEGIDKCPDEFGDNDKKPKLKPKSEPMPETVARQNRRLAARAKEKEAEDKAKKAENERIRLARMTPLERDAIHQKRRDQYHEKKGTPARNMAPSPLAPRSSARLSARKLREAEMD